jgi:flagellar P-ring protein FlgI
MSARGKREEGRGKRHRGFAARGSRLAAAALLLFATSAAAQEPRIRDLTIQDQAVPVRLMGYGLVVGLDGSGDRVTGGRTSGHTVQSVANLLRRFDVEVPAEFIRMRNVAAVLVTAEVSPFLRPGGRFEAHISSIGDARSLRGGVLWMTPLISDVGGSPVATVQGALLISDGGSARNGYSVETTARIPGGGLLEVDLPRPVFASVSRLVLRQPDLGTASRIAQAINGELGAGSATVEDPGAIALALPDDDRSSLLTRIGDIRVRPDRAARVVIDGRDGTVVAGADLTVGEATVSHGILTLTVGAALPGPNGRGDVRVPVGTSVVEIANALHGVQTPPAEIAAILEALREVGALAAEVTVR